MNIIVKKDKTNKQLEASILVWNISDITAENVIDMWRLLSKKHITDPLGAINQKDKHQICGIKSNQHLKTIVDECLKKLQSGALLIEEHERFKRTIYHLIGKILGYTTNTMLKETKCCVGCKSIAYWGSIKKAIFNMGKKPNTNSDRYVCGCDLIPNEVRHEYDNDMDYDDTEVFYYIPWKRSWGVEFQIDPQHNRSIIKQFLIDECLPSNIPMDIINNIVAWL